MEYEKTEWRKKNQIIFLPFYERQLNHEDGRNTQACLPTNSYWYRRTLEPKS